MGLELSLLGLQLLVFQAGLAFGRYSHPGRSSLPSLLSVAPLSQEQVVERYAGKEAVTHSPGLL